MTAELITQVKIKLFVYDFKISPNKAVQQCN